MRHLYYSLVAIILWLSFLFNLEWLVGSFRLAPFLYVFIPACSVFVILGLRRRKVSLPWLLVIGLSVYGVLEYLFSFRMGTANLTTVTAGLSAVVITILLSSLIGKRLVNLQAVLTSLVVGPAERNEQAFADAQGMLYREVRRARRYHHALAVLAISPPKVPSNVSLQPIPGAPFPMRVIDDMQRELVEKYVLARTARLLRDKLEDTAIVTQRNKHFVVLLPETLCEELPAVVRTLDTAAQERLGLTLNIGAATFPDQAITLEGLMEQAEGEMASVGAGNSLRTGNLLREGNSLPAPTEADSYHFGISAD